MLATWLTVFFAPLPDSKESADNNYEFIDPIHRGNVFGCCYIHVEAFVSTAVALVYILFFFVVLHFTLNFVIFYSMHLAFIT